MKWKSVVLALLIACASAIQPGPLAAQAVADDAEPERFGSAKLWDYALCGASIVFAAGTGGWVVAFLVCGRAVTEHWTR